MNHSPNPQPARFDRPRGFALLVLGAVGIYFCIARFFPAAFEHWPLAMHYALRVKHIFSHGVLSWLPLAGTAGVILGLALRMRRPRAAPWVVAGLFFAALALQWSLSFLDEGISARRISSTLLQPEYGHSEFAVLAFGERSAADLAREYELRCFTDRRFVFAQTKPPGQLVFYTLAAHLYRWFPPGVFDSLARWGGFYDRGPLTGFGAFATIFFSVVSCLAVLAMAALGRAAAGRRAGAWAALAWTLCPAAALVTMHMDQVLYPLLAAVTLLFAVKALDRSPVYAMAAGLVAMLAMYVSFSMIFLIPTAVLIWICFLSVGRFRRKRHEKSDGGGRTIVSAVILFAIGLVAGWAFLKLALGFELRIAWLRSMKYHIRWRHTGGLVGVQDSVRNFVEFAIWLGLPAALVYGRVVLRAARKIGQIGPIGRIRCAGSACGNSGTVPSGIPARGLSPNYRPRGNRVAWDLFAALYPVLLLAICVFGHTVAEIGRLWLPLMVPMMIPVVRELSILYRRKPPLYVLAALAMVLIIKNFHDF